MVYGPKRFIFGGWDRSWIDILGAVIFLVQLRDMKYECKLHRMILCTTGLLGARRGNITVKKISESKVLMLTEMLLKFLGKWPINDEVTLSDILVKIGYFDRFSPFVAIGVNLSK